jgi:hydroxypyruvate reductase 1
MVVALANMEMDVSTVYFVSLANREDIRLSYANSMENIQEGLRRMERALKEARGEVQVPLAANPTSFLSFFSGPKWEVHNPNGTKRIVVTKQMPGKRWLDVLVEEGFRVEVCSSTDILSVDEIKKAIGKQCDGVIGQLTEKWGDELFKALKDAGGKAYSNMAVGFDNIDVPAATKHGVAVGNTPGVLTETTAEMAIALTYAAARRVVEADKFMRGGKYKGWLPTMFVGKLLHRGTLGIIGAGRIGAAFAIAMATSEKMNVLYYDIHPNRGKHFSLLCNILRFGKLHCIVWRVS